MTANPVLLLNSYFLLFFIMAVQLSTTARNARLDQIETTLSTAPLLRIFTGAQPANCAAADSGTKLVEMTLPSDWMNAASSGSKTLLGSWSSTGITPGTAAHFRIKDSTGTTCHIQGSVTLTGSGGDMTLDNTNIATSQVVTVNTFTLTDGNA
jgi:hypothetical protein